MTTSDASPLEIRVARQDCRAAGECVLRAPGTFTIGDDNTARVIDDHTESASVIIAAARSCPNFAISVRKDGYELA